MSGVNIPNIKIEDGELSWDVSWDDEGNISYKGTNKDGESVDIEPSSMVVKVAKVYGSAQWNGEDVSKNDREKQEAKDNIKNKMDELGYEKIVYDAKEGVIVGVKTGNVAEIIDSKDACLSLTKNLDTLGVGSYDTVGKDENPNEDAKGHEVDTAEKNKVEEQAMEAESSENAISKIDEVRARGEEVANQKNALEGVLLGPITGGKKSEARSGGVHCMQDVLDNLRGTGNEVVAKIVKNALDNSLNKTSKTFFSGKGPRRP